MYKNLISKNIIIRQNKANKKETTHKDAENRKNE